MDWLRETQWLGWVAAALVLGLIEVASLDLVFVMLSAGALVGAGIAFAGGSFTVQVLAATGTAGLLLLVVRPLALKKIKPAGPGERTNVAGLVGRPAEVLETVSDRGGLVKLTGETWSARSAVRGRTFPVGDVVDVVRIDGATAVVDAPPDLPAGSDAEENR